MGKQTRGFIGRAGCPECGGTGMLPKIGYEGHHDVPCPRCSALNDLNEEKFGDDGQTWWLEAVQAATDIDDAVAVRTTLVGNGGALALVQEVKGKPVQVVVITQTMAESIAMSIVTAASQLPEDQAWEAI